MAETALLSAAAGTCRKCNAPLQENDGGKCKFCGEVQGSPTNAVPSGPTIGASPNPFAADTAEPVASPGPVAPPEHDSGASAAVIPVPPPPVMAATKSKGRLYALIGLAFAAVLITVVVIVVFTGHGKHEGGGHQHHHKR